MSVLHLMHVFPNFGPGGAELRVVKIMNGIGPAARHTILPMMGTTTARAYIDPQLDIKFVEPCGPEASAGATPVGFLRWLYSVIRTARPDVLLTYNFGSFYALAVGAWSGICPVIHNECGFGADEAVRLKTRRVLARRVVFKRVFGVAVTSRTLRDIAIQRFKAPPRKVHWIRTGVDVARFRPGLSREWRRQLGLRDDEVIFGFLGALRPEKNIPLLLRAFAAAQLPNAKLLLIGDGRLRADLERLAQSLGLGGRALFCGYIPDPATALNALDVFALSSSTEQTSNSLLEAMACALPAVVTAVGDNPVVLGEDASPWVVRSDDVGSYAAAVTALGRSAELRREWGERNRRRCVAEFPQERMIREYEKLYYSAAKRTTPEYLPIDK